MRRPLNAKGAAPQSAQEAVRLSATLACEPPNPNLHYFLGRCVVQVPGTGFDTESQERWTMRQSRQRAEETSGSNVVGVLAGGAEKCILQESKAQVLSGKQQQLSES